MLSDLEEGDAAYVPQSNYAQVMSSETRTDGNEGGLS